MTMNTAEIPSRDDLLHGFGLWVCDLRDMSLDREVAPFCLLRSLGRENLLTTAAFLVAGFFWDLKIENKYIL